MSNEDYVTAHEKVRRTPKSHLEFLDTPKSIEREFFSRTEDAPVSQVCKRLEEAGVETEALEGYRETIREYFRRSSQFELMEQKWHARVYRPDEYFLPKLTTSAVQEMLLPRAMLTELPIRPRWTKTADKDRFQEVAVDGMQVLERMKTEEQESPRRSATPEERFLFGVNRLMYALHESLHIYQSAAKGDKLSDLIAREGFSDVISKPAARERLFDRWSSLGTQVTDREGFPIREKDLRGLQSSVIGIPKGLAEKKHDLYSQEQGLGGFLDNHFEAVMDMLSEDALKSYLKKKPALLMWCHNLLGSFMEGLKEARKKGEAGEEIDREVLERIRATVGMIEHAYFGAFESSSEMKEYVEQLEGDEEARRVAGSIVQTDAFSRLDLENALGDCEAFCSPIFRDEKVKEIPWEYPLTKKIHYTTERTNHGKSKKEYPLTDEGVRIATKLLVKCADQQKTSDEMEGLFMEVQNALEALESQDGLRTIQEMIQSRTGEWLSENEVRELYGVGPHFRIYLFSNDYEKRFAFKKKAFHALEKTHQEQTDPYLRALFFRYEFNARQLLRLADMKLVWSGDKKHWVMMVDWEEIEKSDTFSIFRFDFKTLAPQQKARIHAFYEQASEQVPSEQEVRAFLHEMADWKRRMEKEKNAT